jgi:hypothetical protein
MATGDDVADNFVAGRNGRQPATDVADVRDDPADRSQYADAQVPLDVVEVWGVGSFPASDPPSNW